MQGPPLDIDLSFFTGRTLIQVCFGAHDLILTFDEHVSISIESSVGWRSADQAPNVFKELKDVAPVVLKLLNAPVLSATTDGDRSLSLEFAEGNTLYIYNSNQHYESYNIWHCDRLFVV